MHGKWAFLFLAAFSVRRWRYRPLRRRRPSGLISVVSYVALESFDILPEGICRRHADHSARQPKTVSRFFPMRFCLGLGASPFCCWRRRLLGAVRHAADYQQGKRQDHVHACAAAYMGIMVYTVMAAASLTGLVFRHPLADVAAKSARRLARLYRSGADHRLAMGQADVGHLLAMGRCALVSELILSSSISAISRCGTPSTIRSAPPSRRHSVAGRRGGCSDHPFSVDWWNTLHQPASIIRIGGPTIDKAFSAALHYDAAYTVCFSGCGCCACRLNFSSAGRGVDAGKGA